MTALLASTSSFSNSGALSATIPAQPAVFVAVEHHRADRDRLVQHAAFRQINHGTSVETQATSSSSVINSMARTLGAPLPICTQATVTTAAPSPHLISCSASSNALGSTYSAVVNVSTRVLLFFVGFIRPSPAF